MTGRRLLLLLVLSLLPAYLVLYGGVWEQRGEVRRSAAAGYVMPSKFSRILALDHKGVLSDYQLLKTVTFLGERLMFKEELSEEDWLYVVAGLDVVTDLDPYFLDPYILAEGMLTWEAGMYEEANRLLEKGRRHRVDDWQLPFFIGFNYFYFLKDNVKGSEYLMEASRLQGSPSFLPALAARLGYYGGRAQTAIIFLKGLLAQTDDQRLRVGLEKRLQALEGAALLEQAVERFEKEKGRPPGEIEELIAQGYLEELPPEPYGGRWILLPTGRVFSTSRFSEDEQ